MSATETTTSSSTPADDVTVEEVSTLELLAGRVDRAIAGVEGLPEDARATATELRESLEAFHREGLVTIVRSLREDDEGRRLLFDLVDDPLVHALFTLHRIIRTNPLQRAEEALASVRPYLESHGGDVELVGLDGGVARVRLLGSCNGCSMSSQTLKNAVEVALVDGVPEIGGIEVVEDAPTTLIDPASLFRHPDGRDRGSLPPPTSAARPPGPADGPTEAEGGWVRGPGLLEVGDPGIARADVDGASFVVVQDGGVVRAYRNQCGHLALPLDDAHVGGGRLACDHHGFQFDVATGVGLTQPGTGLEPVPCRVEGVHVWLLPDPDTGTT